MSIQGLAVEGSLKEGAEPEVALLAIVTEENSGRSYVTTSVTWFRVYMVSVPHAGIQTFHQKSTDSDAIKFKVSCGTHLNTSHI